MNRLSNGHQFQIGDVVLDNKANRFSNQFQETI